MTPLERNFNCWASKGVCDICGDHTSVISDVMTMQRRCLPCIVKENEEREEQERQKKRIPLDLTEFTEL